METETFGDISLPSDLDNADVDEVLEKDEEIIPEDENDDLISDLDLDKGSEIEEEEKEEDENNEIGDEEIDW